MKKIILMVATAVMMVACGNSSNANSNSNEQTTDKASDNNVVEKSTPQDVGAKAVALYQQLLQDIENDEMEAFIMHSKELAAWIDSLSDEDKEKGEEAVVAWDEEKAIMISECVEKMLEAVAKDEEENEEEYVLDAIGAKAVEMFQQMYQAGENDDLATFKKLAKKFDTWFNGLSEEDQEKAENAVMAWDEEKAEMVIDAANEVLD